MPVLAVNKRANYDYKISAKYEAGMVLFGYEVKSLRSKQGSLKGSFITIKQNKQKNSELFLVNAHFPLYKKASTITDYDPYRSRKLLIKKKEIQHLQSKKSEQGLTLVPIKIYTKHSLIKIEFGLGRGKKKFDKRESIKKRDTDRKIRTLTKLKYQ